MKISRNTNNLLKVGAAALAILGVSASVRPSAQAVPEKPVRVAKESGEKVVKTEAEWKRILTPEQFHVLREKGTEMAGTGKLLNEHDQGTFQCAGCGKNLFASKTKFESGTGWPSFYAPLSKAVIEKADADGSGRIEVMCARCGGHLGHVFDDGPKPTGLRYCMNSVAMQFAKAK